MQETTRLEKSSFALAFHTDKQTEEKKLGVDIACSTKMLLTKRWNSITINAPGYKDLIDMSTGATQDNEAFIMMPAGENTHYRRCQRILQWKNARTDAATFEIDQSSWNETDLHGREQDGLRHCRTQARMVRRDLK